MVGRLRVAEIGNAIVTRTRTRTRTMVVVGSLYSILTTSVV
jgi:hypothetical protein